MALLGKKRRKGIREIEGKGKKNEKGKVRDITFKFHSQLSYDPYINSLIVEPYLHLIYNGDLHR